MPTFTSVGPSGRAGAAEGGVAPSAVGGGEAAVPGGAPVSAGGASVAAQDGKANWARAMSSSAVRIAPARPFRRPHASPLLLSRHRSFRPDAMIVGSVTARPLPQGIFFQRAEKFSNEIANNKFRDERDNLR
ncbi:hypothetical protein [Azospirillum palustre]|uniref:hypothetical protein n=1 Tax=Azospirillum palustre TaxID=2044885 RepID=UPI001FCE617F|nr:hypothetical protein [Azospirillum palustre]